MNNQNTTTPAVTPATPPKDQPAIAQPAQAQTAGVAPAKVETIPAAKV